MPQEWVAKMDVDVVAQAYLFYLLSTTLFTNHGNDADLALMPPLQDLDATWPFNWGATALSYLYYGMDLCVRGAHLKVGYRSGLVSTESSPCRACLDLKVTLMRSLFLVAEHGDLARGMLILLRDLDVSAIVGQLKLGPGYMSLFYDMYYLGERIYEWELSPDQRRVLQDVLYYMLSTRSIQLEQEIVAARRGLDAIDHLAAFVPGAYAIFVRTQLLVHIPPPVEFDHFAEAEELDRGQRVAPVQQQQQHGKRMRRGSDSGASDTAVIVGKLEHGPGVHLRLYQELAWRPLLAEAKERSVVGILVVELDAGW
ncbi:hypothetical protein JCGZ_25297 [Jatropha curcas]|uniref:Aminotransferase-like plant mobile domain-containing protein n=1 Tax=Jatropha curcas TaxID=180498 RepID=A0A067JPV8_JATCU|nr:hypothetical protein JCGZ_25297 [Jatropha curcas]